MNAEVNTENQCLCQVEHDLSAIDYDDIKVTDAQRKILNERIGAYKASPSEGVVIPPLITEVKSRGYAAASNRLGGMPPIAVCGRSLL